MILILKNEEKRLRAPVEFESLVKVLQKYSKGNLSEIEVSVVGDDDYFVISRQEEYDKARESAGRAGLLVNITGEKKKKPANETPPAKSKTAPAALNSDRSITSVDIAITLDNFQLKDTRIPDSLTISRDFTSEYHNKPVLVGLEQSNLLCVFYTTGFKRKYIQNDLFQYSSRVLVMGENSVLVTGGVNYPYRCLSIDLTTGSVTHLSPMDHARFWHAMDFIDTQPVVIGGCEFTTVKTALDSVEMYENGVWKTLIPLNKARSNPSTCRHSGLLYVIGGVRYLSGIDFLHDSIERWNDGQ